MVRKYVAVRGGRKDRAPVLGPKKPRKSPSMTGGTALMEKKGKKAKPTVSDVPEEIKTKVEHVRQKYKTWKQGSGIGATRIIAACKEDKRVLRVVIATMLDARRHKQLIEAIRKQW